MRTAWVGTGLIAFAGFIGCSSSSSQSVPTFQQQVAISNGAALVNQLMDCGTCHTSDPSKPFGGGVKFPIDQAGHYVYSRNLTPDPATGLKLTEDQFIKVMQTGEDFTNHGQVLLVMPWPNFRWLTVDDLKALYAFLQVLPAASNQVPPDNKGPLASSVGPVPMPTEYNEGEETRPLPPDQSPDPLAPPGSSSDTPDPGHALRGAAILPLSYAKMPNFANRTAEEQASFGRGSYLVNAGACGDCHTNKNGQPRTLVPGPDFLRIPADAYLVGGTTYTVPGALSGVLKQTRTMSQNLIGKSGYFNDPKNTYLVFAASIDEIAHAGDDPPLSLGWPMPAGHLRNLPPQSLQDIYTYMKILAEDYDHTGQADKATQDPARYCKSSADCQSGQTCFIDSSGDGSATNPIGNQCLNETCSTDADCNACQTCVRNTCQAPTASSSCVTQGI